jgi:hypothetical protein
LHNSAAPSKCLDIPGYNFFYVASGALDIWNFVDASGTPVQLWDCEPADGQHANDTNQIWYEQNNGDGTWTFKVTGYVRYCLDAQNLGGYGVDVNPCNGQAYQKWTLDPSGQQLQSVGAPATASISIRRPSRATGTARRSCWSPAPISGARSTPATEHTRSRRQAAGEA